MSVLAGGPALPTRPTSIVLFHSVRDSDGNHPLDIIAINATEGDVG